MDKNAQSRNIFVVKPFFPTKWGDRLKIGKTIIIVHAYNRRGSYICLIQKETKEKEGLAYYELLINNEPNYYKCKTADV